MADAARDLRLEALEHLVRLRSGTATTEDAARFLAWRGASAAHEEAFRAAVRLQQQVRQVEGAPANVVPFRRRAATPTRRGVIGGALAASFGGLLVAGQAIDLIPPASAMRADFHTRAGERRLVRLADQATVRLNTRTSIVLERGAAVPTADLLAGEAILHAHVPAALVAGEGRVTASHGRLNVRRDGDAVCVTCLRGSGRVEWNGTARELGVGEAVTYGDAGFGAVERGVDIARVDAWRSGLLIFRDLPFARVVDEINRYRPGHVFLVGDDLAARHLTGTFEVARIDDFFGQAALAFGAKVSRLPGGVVILS